MRLSRPAVLAALAIGGAGLLLVLLSGGNGYTVSVRFANAGQLVKGNLVQVGGRPVGTISDLRLTPDGQAEVVLEIDDGELRPLRRGTIATIRSAGLSGVANRFVELAPGPADAPEIPDGGVIETSDTRPIVDLDAVLDSLDPKSRRDLQGILRAGGRSLDGVTRPANETFRFLNPALSQTVSLGEEMLRDQVAFERLLGAYGRVSAALASRRPDLEEGVANMAAVTRALASERTALQDALARAPSLLRRSGRTMRRVRGTLEVVPAAAPLARLLRELGPVSRATTPVVTDLSAVLPELRQALISFPRLARELVPTVRDTTEAVRGGLPVFAALRPYAPDLIAGFFNGFGGSIGGYYDANGQYVRIAPLQGAGGGQGLASLFTELGQVPGLVDHRTGLVARCPGGAVEPAGDRSNPWTDDPELCNREQDHR